MRSRAADRARGCLPPEFACDLGVIAEAAQALEASCWVALLRGSRAVLAFLGIVSWWHLEVYTLVRRLPLDFPSAAGRQHCCSSRLCVFEVSLDLTRTRVSALAQPARPLAQ